MLGEGRLTQRTSPDLAARIQKSEFLSKARSLSGTPQRNRNELGETSVNKTGRKHPPHQEKSKNQLLREYSLRSGRWVRSTDLFTQRAGELPGPTNCKNRVLHHDLNLSHPRHGSHRRSCRLRRLLRRAACKQLLLSTIVQLHAGWCPRHD